MEKDDPKSRKPGLGPIKPHVGSDDDGGGVGSESGGGVGSDERDRAIHRKPAPRRGGLPGSAPARNEPDFCDAELPGDSDTQAP
jgi:hypothetical protein